MNRSDLVGSLLVERHTAPNPFDISTWWAPAEQQHHREVLQAFLAGNDIPQSSEPDDRINWDRVERVCKGGWEPLTRAEKIEATRYLYGMGHSLNRIQALLHVSRDALRELREAA